mmetsp:Transcript_102835/g.297303  ORF Transcript_102835/g.297303 Transcript_102835/m.297303 type:complete len:332 (+) Transcript_102835:371-1366(+)
MTIKFDAQAKGVARAKFDARITRAPSTRTSMPSSAEIVSAIGITSTATAVFVTTFDNMQPPTNIAALMPMRPQPADFAADTRLAAIMRATPVFSKALPSPKEAAMPMYACTLMLLSASLSVRMSIATMSAAAMMLMLASGAVLNQTSPSPKDGTETRMHMPMTMKTMAVASQARTGSAWRPVRGGVVPGILRTREKALSTLASKPSSSASTSAMRPFGGSLAPSSMDPRKEMSPAFRELSKALRRSMFSTPGANFAALIPGRKTHSKRQRLRRSAPRRRNASPASPEMSKPRTWRSRAMSRASDTAMISSPGWNSMSLALSASVSPGPRAT